MNRASSNVEIKAVSEDRREFEGWASVGSTDRQLDQLVPEGAVFELPLPFLLDHDHEKVVGEVYRAEVEKRGIRFWARIRKIAEPGAAKDLVDYAWALIKNRLRPVVSVGFRPLSYEPLGNGGGLRYQSWEWFELSAVGVAAQPEARITATKRASRTPVVRLDKAPNRSTVVKLHPVAQHRLAGTLKIHSRRQWKPGDPIKVTKTGVRVVKLDTEFRGHAGPKKRLPVVKLTQRDRDRARHRVAKL